MGLPSVQRVKLESLKAVEQPAGPTPARPTATAVASMSPGPRLAAVPSDAPLDESAFEVGAQPAKPGDGPSASPPAAQEPFELQSPRELSPEEQKAEDERKFREESPEWYHKHKTLAGVYERAKSDIMQLKGKIAELETELQKVKEAPRSAPAAIELPPINTSELTPEQVERYSDAFPVIESLSTKQSKAVIDQVVTPLLQRLEALEGKTEKVNVEIKDEREAAFINNVETRIPDIKKIIVLPEWSAYLAKRAPYTQNTLWDLLQAAHNARDLDTVVEIFSGFNRPTKENINDLITPTASGAAAPVTRPGAEKKVLAWSKRQEASVNFRKKRISKEEFDKIDAMFKRAEAEGRIDYKA